MQNFLTNAFRYNPEGRVLLGVRRAGHDYRIEVWDDGDGIPLARQQDIFQEFTRIERQGAEQGLGLGLAIAKGISQILSQPLGLRSWPSRGTVFSMTVDGSDASAVNANPAVAAPNRVRELEGCRVLCVDNEQDILTGMTQLLSRWGCEVRCAQDVCEAIQQISEQWQPEFVLSDYHLTNQQTGLQVLQQCQLKLRACFNGVIISADRSAETQQAVTGLGFTYLSKPVKPLKLRTLLQQRGK
ncbi:hybrid sensor histidine kinase/response regulator [Salinivibrio socompensis]|uniref:hybrid sensor histidine kinase/response regulator n=1 Tax=Salinivibrio socompensis TaxID=1510206 RepID=UPI0004B58B26|nr:hybrid sensor histidine kinase/response regulator [Salinivibrio socompensis]